MVLSRRPSGGLIPSVAGNRGGTPRVAGVSHPDRDVDQAFWHLSLSSSSGPSITGTRTTSSEYGPSVGPGERHERGPTSVPMGFSYAR
jgi:hypothetical protein